MKIPHFLPILLLFSLILGCNEYQRKAPLGGTTYLPLMEGRAMRYRTTESGEAAEYVMRLRYLGGRNYKVYKAYFDGYYPGGLEFKCHEQEVVADMQYSPTSLIPRDRQSQYEQLWIDETRQPGDAWIDEDTGTQTVFTGYESVTVPAGTFDDCYHTVVEALPELRDSLDAWLDNELLTPETYDQELENSKIVIERWFARDVGLVKEELGGPDAVRELVAVESEGTVYTGEETNTESE